VQRAYRTDFAGPVRGVEKTPTGGLRVPAAVTRTGVLEYSDGQRSWREYRPPEEVFAADSLASLRAAPVTDLHPPGKVTAETWQELAKGHVDSAPTRDGRLVVVDLAVQAAPLVALVESGDRREVSSGYECDVEHTPGVTPEGEAYDRVQRRIRYNHLALGPSGWGRAGSEVALRLDGAAVEVSAGFPAAKGTTMKRRLKVGGREFRIDADDEEDRQALATEAQAAIDAAEKKKDSELTAAAAQIKALGDKLAEATAISAQLQMQLAEKDKDEPITEENVPEAVIDSLVEKRLALRADAARVLGVDYDFKGKTPGDIKRAVIGHVLPGTRLDGLGEPVVDGMFAAVVATRARASTDAARRIAEGAGGSTREDGGANDPVAEMQQRTAARWQEPTAVAVGAKR